VIVKPNFEGSSKGITQESVVEDRLRLRALVERQLSRFPAGVLVEEFIPGKDLTVAFLEKSAAERAGVLTPVEYVIDESELAKRRYRIYDYDLKSVHHDAVNVKMPGGLSRLGAGAGAGHGPAGVQGPGRPRSGAHRLSRRRRRPGLLHRDQRAPSLEPGAGIYAAGRWKACTPTPCWERWWRALSPLGLKDPRRSSSRPPRRDPCAWDSPTTSAVEARAGRHRDEEAEYDAPATVQAVREAIAAGARGYRSGGDRDLPR